MDKSSKESRIASLRRQLREMDAQRASIEAQLAALLEQAGPAQSPLRRRSPPCPRLKRSGSFAACLQDARTSSRSAGRTARTDVGVRSGLRQRVGCRSLRQAPDQVRRMPESSVHSGERRRHRTSLAWIAGLAWARNRLRDGRLPVAAR